MTDTRCTVSTESIAEYVADELQGDEALRVAVHLGECRACCEEAADFVALRGALPALRSDDVVRWNAFGTPAGPVRVAVRGGKVTDVTWAGHDGACAALERAHPHATVLRDAEALEAVEAQIREYLRGDRARFDLPLDLSGCRSDFQRQVLEVAKAIPYGTALSYGEVAERIGRPGASRAVGNALGGNPVPIVIPCHRVIRSDGSPGGYVGGTALKSRLLELEGCPVRAA